MKIFTKPNQSFIAIQFTENWKENAELKELCRNYKGTFSVASTKQVVNFGDYVLINGPTILVVTESFLKEAFSESEIVSEQPQPVGEVVVTTNDKGHCLAVTRQNEEGQILSVIWELQRPPKKEKQERQKAEVIPLKREAESSNSEEQVNLQIKQYFLRNEVVEILNNDTEVPLLEDRIEIVKKRLCEAGRKASEVAIQLLKEELELDLSDLFENKQEGQKKAGKKPVANKKVEAPKGKPAQASQPESDSGWMRSVLKRKFTIRH